mmetsp:Transcript_3866/g.17029  ORF Transcript_3866/g.17029 Transcript_3866/m.17029 type:complete len:254 (+) Transcript_3866:2771-3532(+)
MTRRNRREQTLEALELAPLVDNLAARAYQRDRLAAVAFAPAQRREGRRGRRERRRLEGDVRRARGRRLAWRCRLPRRISFQPCRLRGRRRVRRRDVRPRLGVRIGSIGSIGGGRGGRGRSRRRHRRRVFVAKVGVSAERAVRDEALQGGEGGADHLRGLALDGESQRREDLSDLIVREGREKLRVPDILRRDLSPGGNRVRGRRRHEPSLVQSFHQLLEPGDELRVPLGVGRGEHLLTAVAEHILRVHGAPSA